MRKIMFDRREPKYAAIGMTPSTAYSLLTRPHHEIMMQRMHGMLGFRSLTSVRVTSLFVGLLAAASLAACKEDAGSAPAPQLPQVEVISVTTQTVPDEP